MTEKQGNRKLKPYVVHYAGMPDARLEISAESALEAAFVYFQKKPFRSSFVVRLGTEKNIFFDDFIRAFPEAEEILDFSDAQKRVLSAEMDKHYKISDRPRDDVTVGDAIGNSILQSVGLGVIFLVIAIIVFAVRQCS